MMDTRLSFFDQFSLGREFGRAYKRIAEPEHPKAVELADFWREKKAAGGMVMGRDLPSKAISRLLSNLIVYEPLAGCADFRVRHAGTAYITHYGVDVTGKLMSELFDEDVLSYNLAEGKKVIGSGQPEYFDANLSQFGIQRRHYEVVLLPVLPPERTGRWLLCGVFRFD